jgi:hypothetical protein
MIYITVGDIPERQCCGSGLDLGSISSVDPYPDLKSGSESRFRRAKMAHKKNLKNACFEG